MQQRVSRHVLELVLGAPNAEIRSTPKTEALRVEWLCGCFATEHNQRGNVFFVFPCATHHADFAQTQQA